MDTTSTTGLLGHTRLHVNPFWEWNTDFGTWMSEDPQNTTDQEAICSLLMNCKVMHYMILLESDGTCVIILSKYPGSLKQVQKDMLWNNIWILVHFFLHFMRSTSSLGQETGTCTRYALKSCYLGCLYTTTQTMPDTWLPTCGTWCNSQSLLHLLRKIYEARWIFCAKKWGQGLQPGSSGPNHWNSKTPGDILALVWHKSTM